MQPWKKNTLPIVLLLILVTIIFPFRWGEIAFFNDQVDLLGTIWSVSHVSEAIRAGHNPWYTYQMLAPDGISLISHTSVFFVGLLDVFVKNPISSINLVLWLNFVFLAWGFFKLTSIWISEPWIQFCVAVMSVFTAYYQSKFGIHINLVMQCTVPWAAYFILTAINLDFIRYVHSKSKLWIGFLLAGLGLLFDYYTAVTLVFLLLPTFLWKIWVENAFSRSKRVHWWIGVIVAIAIHVIGRLLYIAGYDKKGGIWEAADIRQLFIPSSLGKWLHFDATFPQSPRTENFIYLGWSLLTALLVMGLIFFYRKRLFHFPNRITAVWFGLVLSLMVVLPVIRFNGENLWYTPSALLHFIPILDHFRMPTRIIPIVNFYLALLVVHYLLELPSTIGKWKIPVLLVITFTFVIEHKTRAPQYFSIKDYAIGQAEKGLIKGKTVLSFPWGIRDGLKEMGHYNPLDYTLMLQSDVKLISAYISRISPQRWQQVQTDSFLILMDKTQQNANIVWTESQREIIKIGLDKRKIDLVRIPNSYSFLADKFKAMEKVSWIETKIPSGLYLIRNHP